MDNDLISGKIVKETDEGYLILIPKVEEIQQFKISDCTVKLLSPFLITNEQRKKTWVLINDIAEASNRWGKLKETVHKEMKQLFCEQEYINRFSLSNCSRATATKYIEFLISYILKNNIPSDVSSVDYDDSSEKMMYAKYMSGKCMVCEEPHTRCYVKDGFELEKTESPEKGDKIYFLCDKHGDYLEKKGIKIFNEIYILEPLSVSDSMLKGE